MTRLSIQLLPVRNAQGEILQVGIRLSERKRDLEGLRGAGEMMTSETFDGAFQLPVEDVTDDAAISRQLLLLPSSLLFYSRMREKEAQSHLSGVSSRPRRPPCVDVRGTTTTRWIPSNPHSASRRCDCVCGTSTSPDLPATSIIRTMHPGDSRSPYPSSSRNRPSRNSRCCRDRCR